MTAREYKLEIDLPNQLERKLHEAIIDSRKQSDLTARYGIQKHIEKLRREYKQLTGCNYQPRGTI